MQRWRRHRLRVATRVTVPVAVIATGRVALVVDVADPLAIAVALAVAAALVMPV
jgi:hypothetical protein